MSAHTPGPWIFYADLPSTDPNWHIVTTANKMRVLANVHIKPGSEMDLANARLIAAAPDLLEAAQAMACASHVIAGTWELEKLRAALAKATGEAA